MFSPILPFSAKIFNHFINYFTRFALFYGFIPIITVGCIPTVLPGKVYRWGEWMFCPVGTADSIDVPNGTSLRIKYATIFGIVQKNIGMFW